MLVYFDFKDFLVKRPVITIGAYDGVHSGHRAILSKLCNSAIEKNGESVVVTFWPHPRLILEPDSNLKLINTLEEKISLLDKAGIQHLVIVSFTQAFSKLTYPEFIKLILVDKLKVYHLIVGYNHHFGKNREGNFDKISEYGDKYGFTSEKLDPIFIENEKVSSTHIRNALAEGNVELANKYLGYNYSITGKVITGDKIGRTIGFPTANINVIEKFKLIPENGVYAVTVKINNTVHKGMMNIGIRPSVNSDRKLSLEVHILNFSDDIYGKDITVYFKKWMRKEIQFKSIDQLIQQLNADRTEVSDILGT